MKQTYLSHSPRDTEAFGALWATTLSAGDVILFSGDLGAGKTALTRGFAQGLQITTPVTSPTFTIVNEYLEGLLPLFHFDLYRLDGEEELFDLGFEEYFYRDGVCIVEWSEKAGDFWAEWQEEHPNNALITIQIFRGEEDTQRTLQVFGSNFPPSKTIF